MVAENPSLVMDCGGGAHRQLHRLSSRWQGIYKTTKEGTYAFVWLWMKKYGEGSITVLSRVNNPDNLRHWVVRHSESLGMHATDVWLCKDRQETGSFGSQAPNQRQKPRKENQRRLERRSPSRSPRRLLRSPRAKKKNKPRWRWH